METLAQQIVAAILDTLAQDACFILEEYADADTIYATLVRQTDRLLASVFSSSSAVIPPQKIK